VAINAAVVEPVGWNAYWSLKLRPGGGSIIAGCMNFLTISLPNDRESTDVMEMGLTIELGDQKTSALI